MLRLKYNNTVFTIAMYTYYCNNWYNFVFGQTQSKKELNILW